MEINFSFLFSFCLLLALLLKKFPFQTWDSFRTVIFCLSHGTNLRARAWKDISCQHYPQGKTFNDEVLGFLSAFIWRGPRLVFPLLRLVATAGQEIKRPWNSNAGSPSKSGRCSLSRRKDPEHLSLSSLFTGAKGS